MKNFDVSKWPKVLTEEIIAMLLPMMQGRINAEWNELHTRLSDEQLHQVYVANEKFLREKREKEMETWPQEKKDALMRASAIHLARDHWFVTIYDEYDAVNSEGYYSEISLDVMKVSTPLNYAINTILLRRGYMTPTEKFTCFEKDSPFSMSYPAMIVIDDKQFSSCLHYIVYRKAAILIDREAMAVIAVTTDPAELFSLSQRIKYYEKIVWNMVVKDELYKCIKEKFLQHTDLMELLEATKGTTLVLSDKNDAKWGAGLGSDDPRLTNRVKWPGKNLLGELITEIRADIFGSY